jgi:hypothetical protein
MGRFYLEQLRVGARREREWFRDVATAVEIIAATDITKPVEERAEFATRTIRSRAIRRQLSKQERTDLQALKSGRWGTIFTKASAKAAAEKVIFANWEKRLRRVAATRVTPEWILLVWNRANSRRQRPRRGAEEMRFLLTEAGVSPSETSLVIESIVARLRALSDCIAYRRGVKATLNAVLQVESGPMSLARVLADQPVEVGSRLIMPGLKTVPAIVFASGSTKFLEQLLREIYSDLGRITTARVPSRARQGRRGRYGRS